MVTYLPARCCPGSEPSVLIRLVRCPNSQ